MLAFSLKLDTGVFLFRKILRKTRELFSVKFNLSAITEEPTGVV